MCGDREAEAFGRFCDWLDRLYDLEMPSFIERYFDSPLDLAAAAAARRSTSSASAASAGSPRWWPATSTTSGCGAIFSFQSMYAGLAPYEALAIYAVITYMDTVNGVFVPEGGMHALPVALAAAAEKAGATFRYGTRVDRILLRRGHQRRRSRGVRLADGEVVEADAVVANPDLPVAYRTLLPGLADAAGGPPRPLLAVGPRVARRRAGRAARRHRAPQHPLRPRLGRRLPGDPPRRRAHARPVAPRQRARRCTSRPWRPPGAHALYVLEPTPNLDGQVDWTDERARGPRRPRTATSSGSATRPTSTSRSSSTRSTGSAQGMERGTPFALSHRFRQTGPVPPRQPRAPGARPGVRRLGHGARASACRWCWCRACSPRERVEEMAAR